MLHCPFSLLTLNVDVIFGIVQFSGKQLYVDEMHRMLLMTRKKRLEKSGSLMIF